jgi:hypothetical protein
MRCVVTGQTASGKSVFVRTAAVEPITLAALPGFEFYRLWGTDTVPRLPCDGTAIAFPIQSLRINRRSKPPSWKVNMNLIWNAIIFRTQPNADLVC